jgi:hypothetical protein
LLSLSYDVCTPDASFLSIADFLFLYNSAPFLFALHEGDGGKRPFSAASERLFLLKEYQVMCAHQTLRHMMLEKGGQSTWAKKISSFGL